MALRFNLIAAACENMGIGKNNNLPWRLKTEMKYFAKMTSKTTYLNKKNVVIMGRKTWDSLPTRMKPLPNRINFVLSSQRPNLNEFQDAYSFASWDEIYNKLSDNKFKEEYESIWIIGGSQVYKEAMHSQYFYRLYYTEIKEKFDCDAFFPPLVNNVQIIHDPEVPQGVLEENGIKFQYKVYQNTALRTH